jgi:hypothetical protein
MSKVSQPSFRDSFHSSFRHVSGRNPATPLVFRLFECRIVTLKSDKSVFEPDNRRKELDSGPKAPPE